MSISGNIDKGKDEVIVRIAAQGQYKINSETLKRIDQIDDGIVDIIENVSVIEGNMDNNKSKEKELAEKIQQIIDIVKSEGSHIEDREIIQSDIMIPSSDITLEEAKKVFRDEGIIPDI